MRILIDIGHPKQVHIFKNFTWETQKRRHEILFTARDKEITIYLLRKFGFEYLSLGKHYKSIKGKIFGLIKYDFLLYRISRKFNPDIFLSHGSIYAAHVSFLCNRPHICNEDTGNMEQIRLYIPFTDILLTSNAYQRDHAKKQIRYNGYSELSYLHPNYFKSDPAILDYLKVKRDEKFVIMRFVSWKASHDIGQKGLSLVMKRKAVKELSKYAKVFISSEEELPDDLKPYQIKIPPEKMHDALYYATMYLGEGATMSSECACLGTPAIYVSSLEVGCCTEQEKKYGLVFNYSESLEDQELSIKKGLELLKAPNLKQKWQKRRKKMLSEKIDVTAFMVWFIENYPESVRIMKENPVETQKQFL